MLAQATGLHDESAYDAADLLRLFRDEFAHENTLLLPHADAWQRQVDRPADEPVYLPASAECPHHRIVFAHGFFASALHEVAHWCIAGPARREQVDYGYWYRPDGRNAAEQVEFQRVEARPQAIEKAFTLACRRHFRVSTDNISGAAPDVRAFEAAVDAAFSRYLDRGFPPRAQRFIRRLVAFYGGDTR